MDEKSNGNHDAGLPGNRKRSSGGVFDAYITRINAMKAASGDGNVTNEEALTAANQIIAEATERRAREMARLDEELKLLELAEAIRETDMEVEELAKKRSSGKNRWNRRERTGSESEQGKDLDELKAEERAEDSSKSLAESFGKRADNASGREVIRKEGLAEERADIEKKGSTAPAAKTPGEKAALKGSSKDKSADAADAGLAATAGEKGTGTAKGKSAGTAKENTDKTAKENSSGAAKAKSAKTTKVNSAKATKGNSAKRAKVNSAIAAKGNSAGTAKGKSDKAANEKSPGRRKKKGGKGAARRRRRRMARFFAVLFLCIIVAASCMGTVWLIQRYTPSHAVMPWQDYFGEMSENEAAIILQDVKTDSRALVYDDALYIPYSMVKESLNSRFFWDDDASRMLFTTAEQTFEFPINSRSYSVIDGALSTDPIREESYDRIVLLRNDMQISAGGSDPAAAEAGMDDADDASDDGSAYSDDESDGSTDNDSDNESGSGLVENGSVTKDLYLNLDYLSIYTNLAYKWEKETQHLTIRNKWGEMLTAVSAKENAVRYGPDIKSPILTRILKGEEVFVLEEGQKWMKVLTGDGYIGWVQNKRMDSPVMTLKENKGFIPPEYPDMTSDERITLVWHYVENEKDNSSYETKMENVKGLDVISPTWFSLTDNNGSIKSIGKKSYVRKAHEDGIAVWALVNDFSNDMDTSVLLASTKARRTCIENLLTEAKRLEVDGINLDFEYIDPDDGETFAQFVREMSIACRRNSLVFSVDLVPPYDFNSYLDRVEVGAVADYLINMGYDEHYVGSDPGTIASKTYEERAIRELINMGVPARKILSGVPFYTRIWYSSYNSDGSRNVSSEELSMRVVQNTLNSWGVTPVWDAAAEQYYAGWTADDSVLCEIWIEDEESMARKILLVPKYQLGGTAAWVLGYEQPPIWDVISENINLSAEEVSAKEAGYAAKDAESAGGETENEN